MIKTIRSSLPANVKRSLRALLGAGTEGRQAGSAGTHSKGAEAERMAQAALDRLKRSILPFENGLPTDSNYDDANDIILVEPPNAGGAAATTGDAAGKADELVDFEPSRVEKATRQEDENRQQFSDVREFALRKGMLPGAKQGLRARVMPDHRTGVFRGFFQKYRKSVHEHERTGLELMRLEHPDISDFCQRSVTFLDFCEKFPQPFQSALKRTYTSFVGFLARSAEGRVCEYKDLPRLAMLGHVASGPRKFLENALRGHFYLDYVDNEELIKRAWGDKRNEIHDSLRGHIDDMMKHLPDAEFAPFRSRQWVRESLIHQCLVEAAMAELLEKNEWKAIVLGTASAPFSLTLYDTPADKRPPIIYLSHGFPYTPVMDLHNRADYSLVRGSTDREYFLNLGTPPERLVNLGCLEMEAFPDNELLRDRRALARTRAGINKDAVVILYALTYEHNYVKTKSAEEITELILNTFKLLRPRIGNREVLLLLKYHVTPTTEPHFSFSRNQYPLPRLHELSREGYAVRLLDDIEDAMPSADVMLCHETSVLYDALNAAIPTVSIGKYKAQFQPRLGASTYEEPSSHRFCTVYDTAEQISQHLLDVLRIPQTEAWDRSRAAWHRIYDCGRTEAMVRVTRLLEEVAQVKATT